MRYLNLEVLLLLVVSVLAAEHILEVNVVHTWVVIVPLATWAIYTIDRIRDVRDAVPATGRHRWHQSNVRVLRFAVVGALVGAITVALVSFPPSYWYAAGALGMMTLLHIPLQRSRRPALAALKDVNVGVVFTIAAWALPLAEWLQSDDAVSILFWLPMFVVMVGTILMDVILLSRLDQDADKELGLPSIAVVLGEARVRFVLQVLLMVVLLASGLLLTIEQAPFKAAVAAAPAVLYSLVRVGGPVDRQRVYLELVPTLWILILWT